MPSEVIGFKFGEFVLDCGEEVLRSDGEPVALTPKAFQLLKILVENSGRVVDKQELLSVVWADSFVEESNIPFTVNRLRKALGDSKDEPRFIETVPRRGYRFVAPVTELSGSAPDHAEPQPQSPPAETPSIAESPRSRRSILVPMLGAAALIFAAAVTWLAVRRADGPAAPILSSPFSADRLTTSGTSGQADISPDGRYVAFTEESGGQESIWLRDLDTSENVQIVPPSDDDYFGLTFSGSGKDLYFVRKPGGVHAFPAVYRVGTVGGIPVKLIENVTDRVAVSRDDQRVAFVRCHFRKNDFCATYVADANGQGERRLHTTDNGVHVWDIRFSPDGRSLAVAKGRYSNEHNDAAVYEVDPETGTEKELFQRRFFEIEGVEWLPDGSGVLFTGSDFRDGKSSVWSATRSTGELKLLSKDAASYMKLSLDRSGGKLAAVQQVPDFRINVQSEGARRTLAAARDLAMSGKARIFYSTYDGEIWSTSPTGEGQRQLTNTPAAEFSLCVSPDEKAVFFSSDEGGSRQVWRMNADGTERRPLTRDVGGFPVAATADGQYVYFTSPIGGQLYKVSSAGGESVLVHDKMLSAPVVSPDGAHAAHFVLENMSRKIAVTDLSTKEVVGKRGPEAEHSIGKPLSWSADGGSLYFVSGKEGKNTLWRWRVDADVQEKVADLADGEVLSIHYGEDGVFTYVTGKWQFDVMLLRGLG